MRNFQRLGEVNVADLLHSVQRQPELWNENSLRSTYPNSPQCQVDDIWLRFNDTKKYEKGSSEYSSEVAKVMDETESIFYPAWFKLPQAAPLIFNLMHSVGGVRLGRVMITRLKPGGKILPHVDSGEHALYYDRYHITLQNSPGSVFKCGDEQVCMRPGEVWWFNNQVLHEVVNNSIDDRITTIVDIRTVK